MAQSDYELAAHVSGLNQRTEINSIFDSILTHNSGSTAPTVTKAFMMWVDTSNATYYYLKMRNHDNTAWVTLGIYTVATKTYTSYAEDTVKLTGNQTIDGVKTFSSSPVVPTPTTTGNVITMDNIIQKTPVGIGYGPGSGGTVTQLTSKSTAVTLNKPTGQIVMDNSALAAGAQVVFQFNNSLIGANDIVIPCLIGGGGGINYTMYATGGTAGNCGIWVTNKSEGSLSDALIIEYIIIKGAAA